MAYGKLTNKTTLSKRSLESHETKSGNPMKTNPSPNIFNFSTLTLLGIPIATILVVQPVFGSVADNSLVITENSPTSLTVLYNGSTSGVSATKTSTTGPEVWHISVSTANFNSLGSNFADGIWTEPENSAFGNEGEAAFSGGSNTFLFISDFIVGGGITPAANGSTIGPFGTDTVNGLPIFVTVNDNAATAEGGHGVPERGSTFGLLAFALAALFGASQLRSIRLA